MKIRLGDTWLQTSGSRISWSGLVPVRCQIVKTVYGIWFKGGEVRKDGNVVHIDNSLIICSQLSEEFVLGVLDLYSKLKDVYSV